MFIMLVKNIRKIPYIANLNESLYMCTTCIHVWYCYNYNYTVFFDGQNSARLPASCFCILIKSCRFLSRRNLVFQTIIKENCFSVIATVQGQVVLFHSKQQNSHDNRISLDFQFCIRHILEIDVIFQNHMILCDSISSNHT